MKRFTSRFLEAKKCLPCESDFKAEEVAAFKVDLGK